MKTQPKLKTVIASDTEYENVFVEIYCDEKFVALISQEEGIDHLKLEFPAGADYSDECRSVDLDWFLEAIQTARRRLIGK